MLAGAMISLSMTSASADIYDIEADDLPIVSESCRYVNVTAQHSHGAADEMLVDTEIWSGGSNVGSVLLENDGGYLTGRYYHCPYLDGVGTFRLGPSEVSVWTEDYERVAEYIDQSRGSYTAKQGARVRGIKATRKGSTVTVKAKGQFYGIGEGWTPMLRKYQSKANQKRAAFRLQRRNANGTGSWKTIKSARAPQGKTVTFKAKAKKKAQWRIVSVETKRTFASASKVVRK